MKVNQRVRHEQVNRELANSDFDDLAIFRRSTKTWLERMNRLTLAPPDGVGIAPKTLYEANGVKLTSESKLRRAGHKSVP